MRRGHDVELLFTGVEGKDLSALARNAGVPTRFVDDGYFVAHREELAGKASDSLGLGGPRKQFELILRDLMDPVEAAMLGAARELAARSDVVVGHFLSHVTPAAAAEHRRPFVMIALQPVFGSRHYPPAGAPALGPLNSLLWWLANDVMRAALLARSNRSRAACGLAAERRFLPANLGRPERILVGVSPALFPRPSDWPAHIDVAGFLGDAAVSESWDPGPHVADFLAAGPPVFLSFGSMFGFDDRQTMEAVETFVAALAIAGARGIVQAPAHVIARAPTAAHVCYLERAPHAQLFPRCAAIVHHGGAGTTQSAILAGRGSVVVPHAADQFYWADLLRARGVGAKPLKRPALAAKPLAQRIRAVLDDGAMAPRAAALAAALERERGAEHAAEVIERVASVGAP
ncbi:MAG: glycosyltransferase [Candidatus Binatia bacterium]